jgi:hypothetical protein
MPRLPLCPEGAIPTHDVSEGGHAMTTIDILTLDAIDATIDTDAIDAPSDWDAGTITFDPYI